MKSYIKINFHVAWMHFQLCALFCVFVPEKYWIEIFMVFEWSSLNGALPFRAQKQIPTCTYIQVSVQIDVERYISDTDLLYLQIPKGDKKSEHKLQLLSVEHSRTKHLAPKRCGFEIHILILLNLPQPEDLQPEVKEM